MTVLQKTNDLILDLFWEKLRKFLFGGVTGLYLVFIFFTEEPDWYKSLFPDSETSWSVFLIVTFLGIVAVIYLLLFFYYTLLWLIDSLKFHLVSRVGYGDALRNLNGAFAMVNELKANGVEPSLQTTKETLSSFCSILSKIYTTRTGYKCSASIKLLNDYVEPKTSLAHLEVENIARDLKSEKRDEDKNYTEHQHMVNDNSCFKDILKNVNHKKYDQLYFLHNDLPSFLGYRSSSLDAKNVDFSDRAKNSIRIRRKEWYLDYRSEIVVPILLSAAPEKWPIIGYLCLDCEKGGRKIFNKEYDFPLLRGVADGIYDIILPLTLK